MSTIPSAVATPRRCKLLAWSFTFATKRRSLSETHSIVNLYFNCVSPSRRYENTRRAAQTHLHEMSSHSLRYDLTHLWRTLRLRLADYFPLSPRCRTEQLPTPARKQIQERPTHGFL